MYYFQDPPTRVVVGLTTHHLIYLAPFHSIRFDTNELDFILPPENFKVADQ